MLPEPLHPAVVHFPVVLAVLLPIFALVALWTIRRGTTWRRAWAVPVGVAAALALSAWVAVKTGEAQDERVENVVAERPLETHEESAELFLTLSAGLALVVAAGLLAGAPGRIARVAGTAGAAALVIVALRVGHTGGQLVYRYGAASAYTGAQTPLTGEGGEQGGAITTSKLRAVVTDTATTGDTQAGDDDDDDDDEGGD